MSVNGAGERIRTAMLGLEGVSAHPHRFGGLEYRIGRRELGHVHGDSLVDIPFPRRIRDQVLAAGEAEAHHVLPDSGWVSRYLEGLEDVDAAIQLLRLSHQLAMNRGTHTRSNA